MTPILAIRIAMLGGVLLFGGVTWFVQRTPDWAPAAHVDLASLRMVARILWGIVVAATVVLFLRARGVTDVARASSFAIMGWALGEMVALFGGVIFFLTGIAGWYLAGLCFLALTFVAFPGPRAR